MWPVGSVSPNIWSAIPDGISCRQHEAGRTPHEAQRPQQTLVWLPPPLRSPPCTNCLSQQIYKNSSSTAVAIAMAIILYITAVFLVL